MRHTLRSGLNPDGRSILKGENLSKYVPSLKEAYHLFNSRYFRSRLPTDARVEYKDFKEDVDGEYQPGWEVKIQRVRGINKGSFRVERKRDTIFINRDLIRQRRRRIVYMVLLHEMVHLKLKHVEKKSHGHCFQREMKRLANLGAFNSLW